jgi:glucose/arabinose dehydrogenase
LEMSDFRGVVLRRHIAHLFSGAAVIAGTVTLFLLISGVLIRATNTVLLVEVGRFRNPIALVAQPGTDDFLLAERAGRFHRITTAPDGSFLSTEQVLDISDQVTVKGEGGLAGLAISRTGEDLYVSYTSDESHLRVVSFRLSDGRPVANTQREMLSIEQPFNTHYGGHLLVDSVGRLLIGLGDGGTEAVDQSDPRRLQVPSHDVLARGGTSLLGSLVRIFPTPNSATPYSIPADNPFVEHSGVNVRPEVLAYGLRNPWRFDLDPATGDLWIADVGHWHVEEINYVPAAMIDSGIDFGWPAMEGSARFRGPNLTGDFPPVHEYLHINEGVDTRCAVIGGVVVRGDRLPKLDGTYLFSDFCDGEIRTLRPNDMGEWNVENLGVTIASPASFARTDNGTVYVLSLAGAVYRLDPA